MSFVPRFLRRIALGAVSAALLHGSLFAQAEHLEMGARPVPEGGVSFRVWAPNATAVHVRGAFNSWGLGNPLSKETGTGMWSGVVPAAKAGDAYKYFVTNAAANGATTVWRRDPYSRAIDPFSAADSNSVVYDPDAFAWGEVPEVTAPALNEAVIYELHIGSFNAPGGTPATFDQAITRLDKLVELGVNVVQVMPLHDNPITNDWGYDPTMVHAVEQDFGGSDAFKRFVRACHQRGLAVVVDVVYNHAYGPGNDMWEFDLWSEQDGGGIWFFNDADHRDSPWGPRYDYTKPEVREFLLEHVRQLLTEFRVDGIRFDATGAMRHGAGGDVPGAEALLAEMATMMDTEFPGTLAIAEDFENDRLATVPVAQGGMGFDTEWSDFWADLARLLNPTDSGRDMTTFANRLRFVLNGDPFHRVIYADSHDSAAPEDPPNNAVPYKGGYLPRRLNQVDPATNVTTAKLTALGSVFALTAPGVPMLFMGQEYKASSVFTWPSPPAMNWTTLESSGAGFFAMHRDLIALRRNLAGTTAGLLAPDIEVYHVNTTAKVIVYRRYGAGGPGDDTVVVANVSANSFNQGYIIGVPADGSWKVRFCSTLAEYHTGFDATTDVFTPLTATGETLQGQPARLTIPVLPPYTAYILSQDGGSEAGWMAY